MHVTNLKWCQCFFLKFSVFETFTVITGAPKPLHTTSPVFFHPQRILHSAEENLMSLPPFSTSPLTKSFPWLFTSLKDRIWVCSWACKNGELVFDLAFCSCLVLPPKQTWTTRVYKYTVHILFCSHSSPG